MTSHAQLDPHCTFFLHAWLPVQVTSQRPAPQSISPSHASSPLQVIVHALAREQSIAPQSPPPQSTRHGTPGGQTTSPQAAPVQE